MDIGSRTSGAGRGRERGNRFTHARENSGSKKEGVEKGKVGPPS